VYANRPIDFSLFPDSPYAQQLCRGHRWLRFSAPLELEFSALHVSRIRLRVLISYVLFSVMTLSQCFTDPTLFSDPANWSSLMLSGLLLVLGNLLVWGPWYSRYYLPVTTAAALLCSTVTTHTILTADATSADTLLLLFVFNVPLLAHFLLGLPFYRALLIDVVCLGVLFVTALLDGLFYKQLDVMFFIPTVTFAAAAFAYTAESASRTQFLQQKLLGEIASHDALTGLQNRGSLDEYLGRLWKHAQRSEVSIGLIMVDIDHFKAFNDTAGHQAGDDCLRRFAAILKSNARRPLDFAARYGGEEFVIVLSEVDSQQLHTIGEAIRIQLEALAIPSPSAPRKIVTVSCGAAVVIPAAGRSMHGLIQMADEALYVAKGGGRNAVHLSEQNYTAVATGQFQQRSRLRSVA
jgi:diguanylate cyclase (GGDEF)-like protein